MSRSTLDTNSANGSTMSLQRCKHCRRVPWVDMHQDDWAGHWFSISQDIADMTSIIATLEERVERLNTHRRVFQELYMDNWRMDPPADPDEYRGVSIRSHGYIQDIVMAEIERRRLRSSGGSAGGEDAAVLGSENGDGSGHGRRVGFSDTYAERSRRALSASPSRSNARGGFLSSFRSALQEKNPHVRFADQAGAGGGGRGRWGMWPSSSNVNSY